MIYRIVGLTGTLKHRGLVSQRDTVLVKLVQLYIAYRLTHQYTTHASLNSRMNNLTKHLDQYWQYKPLVNILQFYYL